MAKVRIKVFIRLFTDNSLRTLFQLLFSKAKSLEFLNAKMIANTDRFMLTLSSMHKEMHKRRNKKRADATKQNEPHKNIQDVNFSVGEFVLVTKRGQPDGQSYA